MSYDYLITADVVKNALFSGQQAPALNSSSENLIEIYRQAAADKISSYVGYNILKTSYTDEVYSGNGKSRLYLRSRPITEVTSVSLDGTQIDDYTVHSTYLSRENGWTRSYENISVSYKAGYTSTSMPGDIKLAALQLITMWWNRRDTIGMSSKTQGVQSGSTSYESIAEEEKKILGQLYSYAVEYHDD